MALPTSYLTSIKNVPAFFDAMRNAKAPEKFTVRFLESLDFTSSADRLFIGVLKSLGFIDAEGRPQEPYFQFLDQTQSSQIIAEGIRRAYADLFQVNTKAHTLTKVEVVNKFKTLSQGTIGESVLDKMSSTFLALVKLADFETKPSFQEKEFEAPKEERVAQDSSKNEREPLRAFDASPTKNWGGLHYNIQIILPESRDPKVYDALFRSLNEHLFR